MNVWGVDAVAGQAPKFQDLEAVVMVHMEKIIRDALGRERSKSKL